MTVDGVVYDVGDLVRFKHHRHNEPHVAIVVCTQDPGADAVPYVLGRSTTVLGAAGVLGCRMLILWATDGLHRLAPQYGHLRHLQLIRRWAEAEG